MLSSLRLSMALSKRLSCALVIGFALSVTYSYTSAQGGIMIGHLPHPRAHDLWMLLFCGLVGGASPQVEVLLAFVSVGFSLVFLIAR